jgi:hypothetical protein
VVSLLRSFVLIIIYVYKSEIWKVKFESKRKNVFFLKKNFVRTGFLTKIGDNKGHVFKLLFSDELYNFARGGEKRNILGINRSTFCFEE